MKETWTNRAWFLHQEHHYNLAEQCANIALHFRTYARTGKAQPFLCRALSRYELDNMAGAQRDINEIKNLDKDFARVRKNRAQPNTHYSCKYLNE